MRRIASFFVALVLVGAILPSTAGAAPRAGDIHSKNMSLIGSALNPTATNTDLAFWGHIAYAGTYAGPRILDISNPSDPRQLSFTPCNGGQGDVSVWKNLLFVSVDAPQSKPTCDSTSNAGSTPGWEGIRIFDVSDPTKPKYISSVATDCGSHTNTLVPDPKHNAIVLYIESYPLLGHGQHCNVHDKISVVKVPLDAPQKAAVVSQPIVAPAIGCHDVTVNIPLHIAAAACISEGQIWDISDPENPVIKTHIYNPALSIWHSAAFTMDGKYVAFGDEFGGGDGPGCPVDNPDSTSPMGAIWFYKVSDPTTPVGHYSLPRGVGASNCTAHNFDIIPIHGHYILAGCGYSEGTFVVDFTDPANPKELGFYDVQGKQPADTWSSYWYNGYIYANDIGRGVDVFKFNDPIVEGAMRFPYLNPQTQMVSFTK